MALPNVIVPVESLSSRALLILILERLATQGEQLSAITDAVAAAQAAVDQLKVDIATEIQQVIDALNANQDVQAALDGLNAITAQLQAQSAALQADDPVVP